MIERAITEKDINSRFYQHNEGLANRWEKFIHQHNGNIDGIVNGFILEAKASLNYKKKKIKINVLRQLSNKTASHSTGFLMTKNTVIEFDSIRTDEKAWSLISQNKILKLIYSLTKNCKTFSLDNRYMFISKNKINESGIFDLKYWKDLSSIAEIRRMDSSDGKIRIEFLNFLGPESAETVINTVLDKNSVE